jgi:L-alanine-DL-glutamate epimerase-like enolase superfamily enzyme
MKLQLGGFLESRMGFTAASHLALTSDNIIHYDFDTPLMFVEDPVIGGISFDNKGIISVPETTGLGATVDERYLSKQTKQMIN